MQTNKNKPSFETAINSKNRTKRLFQVAGAISPVVIFILTVIISVNTSSDKFVWSMLTTGATLILMLFTSLASIDLDNPETEIAKDKLILIESTIGTIGSIYAIAVWISQYNTTIGKIMNGIVSAIPQIFIGIIALAITILILCALSALFYQLIKWIAWNGYSENFIAITKARNIAKFNKIKGIPEKLDANADLTLVKSTLSKYKPELKTAGKNKLFW